MNLYGAVNSKSIFQPPYNGKSLNLRAEVSHRPFPNLDSFGVHMKLSTASALLALALLASLSQTAFAGSITPPPPTSVPEPEVLTLLAIGGVAMAAAKWRNRRK
jgi:hypothetical protein